MTFVIDHDLVRRLATRLDDAGGEAAGRASDARRGLAVAGLEADVPARLDRLADDYTYAAGILRTTVDAVEANELDAAELAAATGLDRPILDGRIALLAHFDVTEPADVLAVLLNLGPGRPDPDSIRDLFPLLPPSGHDPDLDAAIDRLDAGTLPEFVASGTVTVGSGQQRADLVQLAGALHSSSPGTGAGPGARAAALDDDELGRVFTGGLATARLGHQLTADVAAAVGPVPERADYPPGPAGDDAYLADFEQNRRDAFAAGRNLVGPVDSEDSAGYRALGSLHGAQQLAFGHDIQAAQAEVQYLDDPGFVDFDIANGVTAVTGYAATVVTAPAISAFNAVFGTTINPAAVGLAVADVGFAAFGYDVEAPPADGGSDPSDDPVTGDRDGDGVPDSFDPDPDDPDVDLPGGEFDVTDRDDRDDRDDDEPNGGQVDGADRGVGRGDVPDSF